MSSKRASKVPPGHEVSLGGARGTAYAALRQRRTLARHHADLVEPLLTGDALSVAIAGQRHGLPEGVELAPGDGVIYVQYRGSICALVESRGRVMQLNPDRDLAERIRAEHFQR